MREIKKQDGFLLRAMLSNIMTNITTYVVLGLVAIMLIQNTLLNKCKDKLDNVSVYATQLEETIEIQGETTKKLIKERKDLSEDIDDAYKKNLKLEVKNERILNAIRNSPIDESCVGAFAWLIEQTEELSKW